METTPKYPKYLCECLIEELKEKYPQEEELPETLIKKLSHWLYKKFVEKRIKTISIRIVPSTYDYEDGIKTDDLNCFILRKYAKETINYLKNEHFNVAEIFSESEFGVRELIVKLWDYYHNGDTRLDIY